MQPVPAVSSLSPAGGDPAGGTKVTISGTDFTSASAVSFGATPAAAFTVNSDTQITAFTPAAAAGTVDVRVTTPAGQSLVGAADRFTFATPAPTALAIPSIVKYVRRADREASRGAEEMRQEEIREGQEKMQEES